MSAIRCILFDLGGVLMGFRGVERVAEWSGDAEAGEKHWRLWLRSPSVRAFEVGELSPEGFAEAFLAEFEIDLEPTELLDELWGFVTGPSEGAAELLDELRPHFLIACLSNTNALHWPRATEELDLDRRLQHAFPSHETGFVKPDREAFDNVLRGLELPPGEILFFDDAQLNIEAAETLGFAACRVEGPADCRRELVRRGLLAPSC